MTATAKRAKKNMKEDQLVTATVRASEWAQEHFNQVIIGIVALVAAVAIVVFVAHSRATSAREAERQMGSAMTLMQRGDLNAALASFQQISERQGGDNAIAARFFAGECELQMGNYSAAADDYGRYLARKSDFPVFAAAAAIGQGYAYAGLKQWSDAQRAFGEALSAMDKKDPRYYEAAFELGFSLEQTGNRTEALKYYEMVADNAAGRLRDRGRLAAAGLR